MRQMAAPSGRSPRPVPAAKGQNKAGAESRPVPIHRPRTYAAIDLGTNNCRLLIARPQGGELVVIDAFSRIVRLGEGLHGTGKISQAAMDRTVAALSVCADKLRRRHVTLSRAVATEACRRASNGEELAERVKRETGIALDIISAAEEAKLAVLGCHNLMEAGDGPALIFDIGGGSTELMHIDASDDDVMIRDWISVPWGVVSLTEHASAAEDSLAARQACYAQMREVTREAFAAFAGRAERFAGQPLRLLGTSGTVTTLASVFLDLPRYDRRAVDGLVVPSDAMREISRRLADASIADRSEIACIGRERADLVVAGCAILESIIDLWPAARVGVADRGIREGILRTLARQGRDVPVTRREFRK
ncbi:Ppx/GppA phosphatase family protein [Sphingopyxis macrogoltabida]|uniref:Exopolyphosphatase n=1 Tax=Sphingopyxis macrogoltabida TaxID=33050 RepID=A0AAC9FHB6_SPHMC|nr:Ppx/GppA phosphatase family protein [Sphingopyxis macrogoltabida]ALJ16215.1 exopolyphosphatase [Sphingopyxis macrogoltabida]AMU92453.1 exopolyphosphatase [Sphingopyxis macrogoltabida]